MSTEKKNMFHNEKAVWKGEPVVFSRNGGTSKGLMIGARMYTFGPKGELESCIPLVWQEMQAVIEATAKQPGAAMGAHARLLKMEKRNGSTEVERDKGSSGPTGDKT
jgi:hypothetical protein